MLSRRLLVNSLDFTGKNMVMAAMRMIRRTAFLLWFINNITRDNNVTATEKRLAVRKMAIVITERLSSRTT